MAKYNPNESLGRNAMRGVDITVPEPEEEQQINEEKSDLDGLVVHEVSEIKGVKMKYLFIARVINEPDNNTPQEQIWCKVVECDVKEVANYEKSFRDEFMEISNYDVEIIFEPLDNFEDEWFKISDLW